MAANGVQTVSAPGRPRSARRPSHWGRSANPTVAALQRTIRTPMGAYGVVMLALLVIGAAGAPLIAPYDPIQQHLGAELLPPGAAYLLGTDHLGRDLLSRLIWGSRASLLVGVISVALGGFVGVSTGLLAGYRGGWVDASIMRIYDALLAFPGVLLAIAIIAITGPGVLNVALAIAVAQMPNDARLARSIVLAQREREYVQSARSLGATGRWIMLKHLLPNTLPPMLVQFSIAMGFAVLAEAGLSFLGLGTQPPTPSWGGMLNESRGFLRQAPWFGVWPGLMLAALMVGLNYLSDALREALDPRRVNAL
jgi:ABC-type dipeptide/oligopeptide/nickel transport system permease subunit